MGEQTAAVAESPNSQAVDHSSRDEFFQYYAEASASEATLERYGSIQTMLLRVLGPEKSKPPLQVGDIGCGAGTQCMMWARLGHAVHGLDVNERLIELGRQRSATEKLPVIFYLGTATALPWDDNSLDVVISPELLEHVADWQSCVSEAVRVLKPGGILFLTTTNKLCPLQQEFTLPLYSWYPGPLKRYYEKLALTTRPEIANHATYPAVNWFTYYGLRDLLEGQGFACRDRFDTLDVGTSKAKKMVKQAVQALPPLRLLGQMMTSYTQVVAIKAG